MNLADIIGEFDPSKYIGERAFITEEHPRIAAVKEMQSYGLKPPAVFGTGKLFRFQDAHDKSPSEKAGWAIYYEYQNEDRVIGTCVFGSFHGVPEKTYWSNKRVDYMTPHERSWYNERISHAREIFDATQAEAQAQAAAQAERIYGISPTDCSQHPYVLAKGIVPYKARIVNDYIVVPIMIDGKITSLQYIKEGEKRFLSGGRIKGGYLLLGDDGANTVIVCEGWATGCSIHEATGLTVAIAFSIGNLFEVCSKLAQGKTVIISADNDWRKPDNPGLTKATLVAQSLGCQLVAPDQIPEGKDFNDVHKFFGLDAVKKYFLSEYAPPPDVLPTPQEAGAPEFIKPCPGAVSAMTDYYNATSGIPQQGFALQTALAIASLVCGRNFKTDENNRSCLYFINVGKTAAGKEHAKKTIDKILYVAGQDHLISGDGFTADSAVISLLMAKPRTICVIDEFGRYMEASNGQANSMQRTANTAIMEAITRPDGTLRAKNYSTMSMSKEQAEEVRNRYIYNPSLTLMALTTPDTLYDNITEKSIKDGFLNRFIMFESYQPRGIRPKTQDVDVPESIVSWIRSISKRTGKIIEVSSEMPSPIEIRFTQQADKVRFDYAQEVLDWQVSLEKDRLDDLLGRNVEFAMRLSLICALSRDPETEYIHDVDMKWACDYMRRASQIMIESVKKKMSSSPFEASKKEVLGAIKEKGKILYKDMVMMSPFSKHKPRELKEILGSLVDAGELEQTMFPNARGRASLGYLVAGHEQNQGCDAQTQ